MDSDKEVRLATLRARLDEIRRLNPAHCSDTNTFVSHQMSPRLYEEMESLEQEIARIEAEEG